MFSRAPHRFLMSFRSRIWLYRLKNAVFLWVATMIQTLPGTYWKNCPKRTILLQHLLLIEVAVFICNSGNWKYQNLVKHTSIPYFFILVQGSLWLVRLIFFHFMFWLLFTRYFFCHDLLSSPFFFSLLVVTHIRGHRTGSSPPSPLRTVRALHFYREKIWALSSLVDSHRIVPIHARRSQQQ